MTDMMNKIKKILFSDKYIKYIVIIGIVGIALIFLSGLDNANNDKKTQTEDNYAEKTEERINNIVCRITGEKKVGVMVSLESNGQTIYANAKNISTNNKTDNQASDKYKTERTDDSKQEYIIIKNAEGGEEALIVSKIAPGIKGVVVVTKYANNSAVCERITTAIVTALDISEKKVCVVMGN